MTDWTKAKVLVTGGTQGIGRAVAQKLLERGAWVTIVGRDAERTQAASESLASHGGRVFGVAMAIDGREEVGRLIVDEAVHLMNGLTAVVNAAGGAPVGHALTLDWNIWRHDWDVKFWGYLSIMRAAADYLEPGGAIVNILGIAGVDPNARLASGTTINGALRGLTKILADDLAPRRIRVVAVNPSATETDLLMRMAEQYAALYQLTFEESLRRLRSAAPLGELPQAGDVAAAVLFLLSDSARMITGSSIDIDGGMRRGPA
ncbi:MAG: SDR family NAD(P)-dependent oxidoreductase [Firmicutes bacterium]|nr:SDR family NAD(P)-dependent oxidoreductase [Bacillota bacterium]